MEDYKKMIDRLREEPKDSKKAVLSIYDLCVDAAYAIESLLDKLKYAEGERDVVTKRMIELEQEIGRLRNERDAAAEDIRKMLIGEYGCICEFCTHDENTNAGCIKENGFGGWCCENAEWRGLQKEA